MNMNKIGIKQIFDFFNKLKNSSMYFVPNLILPVDKGNGRSFLTKAFVEAIEGKIDFSSTDKFIEFDFDEYDYNINSIKEMIGTIKSYSGTRNEFNGVIGIGVDTFCEHPGEHPTRFFLDMMKKMSENAALIFFVSQKHKENTFIKRLQKIEPIFYIDSSGYTSDELADIAFANVSELAPEIIERERKKEALKDALGCRKIQNAKEATALLKNFVIDGFLNTGGEKM